MTKYCLYIAFSVTAAIGAVTAAAQTQNLPPALRESLKNIPAASGTCRKEDFAEKPSVIGGRATRKPDLTCAITLEKLSPSLGKPEMVLIDVRSKIAFDSSHINGAINFNTAEIHTKRFLSNKSIVLLGDGKTDQDLYGLCADLKEVGFNQTKVLRGGMLAWVLENKEVIGTTPNYQNFASLSPGELFQASKLPDSLVVILPSAHKLADVLPMAVSTQADSLDSIKEFIQKRNRANVPHTIVLVADERFDKNEEADIAKAIRPDPLLIYTGSEIAYRQFLRVQNAMWVKQAKGPTKPRCGAL